MGGLLLASLLATLLCLRARRQSCAALVITDLDKEVGSSSPSIDKLKSSMLALALRTSDLPDESLLTPDSVLCSGFFGSVYLVRDQTTGQLQALKVFDLSHTRRGVRSAGDYAKEVELLSRLNHPAIVRIIGHASTESKGYLLMKGKLRRRALCTISI